MQNLTEKLNIKYPIISAPMGMISGAKLACEVTAAGGLGLIGGGYCDKAWIQQQLELAIPGQFGIGFITWRLQQFPDALDLALSYKPRAVMLSFGCIRPFVKAIREAGASLICQVQSVEQAIEALEQDADVIVAQGTEAGGHGADEPLRELLPQVLSLTTRVPIVAAGGLVDGEDILEMMSLGAQGVLMGTRFYASHESLGTVEQKQQIISARAGETVRTRVFDYPRGFNWPQPYTGRALKNTFYQKWRDIPDMQKKLTADDLEAYHYAVKHNDFNVAGIFVGKGVERINTIWPVAKIMTDLCQDAGLL